MATTTEFSRVPRLARWFRPTAEPARRAPRPPPAARPTIPPSALPARDPVDLAAAEAFIRLFHAENADAGSPHERLAQVREDILATGTYTHTYDELAFGARAAWRNSDRCIGRLYWNSLQVRDRRDVRGPEAIFDACVEHLRFATNGGRIRPTITIFAPPGPDGAAPAIRNDQLIRYAGYRAMDGSVVGDPAQVEFTRTVERMGWRGDGGAFDVLPLVVTDGPGPPHVMELPADAVLEVPIVHPQYEWFVELGLRWHAVPAISNMDLEIGGIRYTAAPFNGWYMGTEIGARNFGDGSRYDLLPGVAARLGLDTTTDRSLWRDRALVELNVAVLHSFTEAGASITDHHTESSRFMMHLDREQRAGRAVPGDWSWLVPPMSGSATPVFHRYYDTATVGPAFLPRSGGCPVAHG